MEKQSPKEHPSINLSSTGSLPNEYTDAFDVFTSKHFYHAFTEMLPACLFAKDRDGRYIYVNDAFVSICNIKDRKSIIGGKPSLIFNKDRAKRAEEEDLRIMKEGNPIVNKINLDHLISGEDRYFMVTKVPVKNSNGETIGLAGMLYDITERQLNEKRLKELYIEVDQQNKKLEEDLTLAKEVQTAFMALNEIGVERSEISIAVEHHASNKLGGDLIITKEIEKGVWSIFLCDVMGHGVRAALITALLRGIHDELIIHIKNPDQFLTKLNNRYHELLRSLNYTVFATCSLAIVDTNKRSIDYTSAGHHNPIWHRFDGSDGHFGPETTGAPAIGIVPNFTYSCHKTPITESDIFLFFTDGVWEIPIEGNDPESNQFLKTQLRKHSKSPPSESLRNIHKELLNEHETFPDDVCLVAVKIGSMNEPTTTLRSQS